MATPKKRSVTIAGHRTSITLEPAFWQALKDIAAAKGVTTSQLITDIDHRRSETGEASGLSSAIRTFVLHYYRDSAFPN